MTARHTDAQCRPSPTRSRHRGQGLVELALLTPLMVLMLVITVDFARAYSAYIQVTNAARAGAVYGSRSSAMAHNTADVKDAALRESPTIYGTAPLVSPDPTVDTDYGGYERITVTVTYDFVPLFSFGPIPSSVTMSRTVTMRVL